MASSPWLRAMTTVRPQRIRECRSWRGCLHMVAVAPTYRRRGLGRCISLAALVHMRERGCRRVVLDTDDFRLAAIPTYLGLGFAPDILAADHSERWRTIFAELSAA